MPVTAIDANTALIVVDMLKGIVALPLAHPAPAIIADVVRWSCAMTCIPRATREY